MEYDRRRVKILLNRANTNVGIEREDVLAILGRDVDILVPSHRDITRSVNQGEPIAGQRGTEAAKAFRALAELYSAWPGPPTRACRRTAARTRAAPAPVVRRRARSHDGAARATRLHGRRARERDRSAIRSPRSRTASTSG